MAESKMSDIIRASVDGIKSFTDMDTVFGRAITTPGGVTVIPVSKITLGFATGGVDLAGKRNHPEQNFGGGGGTGVSINPIAFLTISPNSEINLINLKEESSNNLDKVFSLIENTPDLINKIKDVLG